MNPTPNASLPPRITVRKSVKSGTKVTDNYWNASHTLVHPEHRGYSIARKLVDKLADTARAEGVKILPTCSYAKHVMEKDAAFEDVLFKQDTP